jgi:hypothetical protein
LSDKDYGSTSAPTLPLQRFLNDYDKHEHFRFSKGEATRDADLAALDDSVTAPDSRHNSSDKIGRSKTAKRSKKAKMKKPTGAEGKETSKDKAALWRANKEKMRLELNQIEEELHKDGYHINAQLREFITWEKPDTVLEVCEQTRDATITPSLSPSSQEALSTFYRLPAFNYLRRLFQPRFPKEGYQRITWNCGCGESMYADVKELYPGTAQSLQETLRISAAAVSEAASNQDNITMPPIVHLPSASAGQSSSDSQTTPGTPLDSHSPNDQTAGTSLENSTDTDEADIVKRYLLMCINTSKRVHLEQIEVTYVGDDQVLFQGIQQAYYNTCKSQNAGLYVSIPGFLGSLFGEISFWRPKNANFVRVRISPYPRKVITSTNKP